MDFQIAKMKLLKGFIFERLTFAADEIFGAVDKIISECQEEVDRTKEENARLQRLDLVFNPVTKRVLQSHGAEEEVAPGRQLREQEFRISLGQENPEPTLVKEEQLELWPTQEEEQLPGLESDTEDFVLTPPSVRTDFYQVLPQPTLLYQPVENRERTPWDSQLAKAAVQIKTEPVGECYGGPGPSDSLLLSVVNPDITGGVESSGLLQSVFEPLNPGRTENHGRFQCKVCGKFFNWKHGLNHHMMIHIGTKPFKCKECGRCFNWKSVLDRHMVIHTGDRPFRCTECGKGFYRKVDLSRHMMIHTGEKPFKCKECGKGFIMKQNMNSHMRIHTKENV